MGFFIKTVILRTIVNYHESLGEYIRIQFISVCNVTVRNLRKNTSTILNDEGLRLLLINELHTRSPYNTTPWTETDYMQSKQTAGRFRRAPCSGKVDVETETRTLQLLLLLRHRHNQSRKLNRAGWIDAL